MKKLFIITMSLVAFTLQAQDVTFGAKAGLNFASLDITRLHKFGKYTCA